MASGWQRELEDLTDLASDCAFFGMDASKFTSDEFDSASWSRPSHQMQYNFGVMAQPMAGK
jgi:hypothetical protein